MTKASGAEGQRAIGRYSPLMFAFFARVFERTLRKGTHRVGLACRPSPAVLASPRLVIYTNHASWWDGVVFTFLAHRLLSGRRVFTPIDAAMMERYRFFARIGGFGVEKGRLRGARAFRAASKAVLSDPTNVLLLAAQDRFADPRERPLRLASGVAHLAALAPNVIYLPLAIEYPLRNERRPDTLLRFGRPVHAADHPSRDGLAVVLEQELAATMDALAHNVVSRDDAAFHTVLSGNAGIDPVYDAWRRFRAAMRGKDFRVGHGTGP